MTRSRHDPIGAPAFVLGIGFGAFVDGIVLHQILQWHHMLSNDDAHPVSTVAGLEANTLADGLFHLVAFIVAGVGAVMALRAWQARRLAPPWRVHIGSALAGWGAFNVVEGLVDHHILRVHHVRDDVADPLWWDLGFLAISLGIIVVGVILIVRKEPADSAARRR